MNFGEHAVRRYAFEGFYRLTSMTIPNSVTNIGDWAFGYCSSLTNVTIPNSVISIGNAAFEGCSGLTSVTIPNSVTKIDAFAGCSGLTSLTIPNSVTSIGELAFEGCSGLTNMVIGNSVTSIGDQAFRGCSGLTSVVIPSSVTSIGGWAFLDLSGLHSVYFQGNAPNGITGSLDTTIFQNAWAGTVFYLPGTTGWGATFGGRPTALWYQPQPQILGSAYGLDVRSNAFHFTVSWATNLSLVVEASSDLANWTPLTTNALASGTNSFSDSSYTNYSKRFYRVRTQ